MRVVEMIGVTKRFPGVVALDSVDFDLQKGEIHGLVGENGAGKSTLVKILTGVLKPNAGRVFVCGKDVTGWSVVQAYKYVAAVYQDRELVPFLTGLQNLFLGIEKSRWSIIDESYMRSEANRLMNRYGIDVPLDVPVRELSPGQATLVTVLKVLLRRPKIVVFDEATAWLSHSEKELLLRIARELRSEGLSLLYISHDLSEVLKLCDRITVLRNGKKVSTLQSSHANEKQLIELMIDRNITEQYPKNEVPIGDVIIEARSVSFSKLGLKNVSFSIRSGEIVGFAGLVGSGRTELARAIYLGKRCDSGSITFLGKPYQARSSYDAVRMGIVMVPENRRTEGLILNETIKNNLTLPALRFASRFGFLSERTLIQMSENVVKRLSIKLSSLMQPVRTLSGGNQQKVSVGKWFTVTAKLWIFDEPTQGIDVDAKREIYEIFGEIVAQGAGVWFISSDLRELIALSDRIYVMRKGEIIFEQKRPFDQGEILARMLGSDGK